MQLLFVSLGFRNMRYLEVVITLLALEILSTLAHVPMAPLLFKCPHGSPKTRTDVGTYCGRRETVIWPGKRTTQVDIYYG